MTFMYVEASSFGVHFLDYKQLNKQDIWSRTYSERNSVSAFIFV